MIRQVHRSTSAASVLRGLYRGAQPGDVRLIASWDEYPAGLAALVTTGPTGPDTHSLAFMLAMPVRACDRAPHRYVYHLALRNAPEDRRLCDEEWAEVAAAMMAETGIAPADDLAGCRWIALRVEDAAVHVVATLARDDGREPRFWGDFVAAAGVAHRYEQRYGLASTDQRRPR